MVASTTADEPNPALKAIAFAANETVQGALQASIGTAMMSLTGLSSAEDRIQLAFQAAEQAEE
jgi:hypothetical protein